MNTTATHRLTIYRDTNSQWAWSIDAIDGDDDGMPCGIAASEDDAETAGLDAAHKIGLRQISGNAADGIALA